MDRLFFGLPSAAAALDAIVLEVSRCDCTGPGTIVFDENWPDHVVAYHLPQECSKSRRVTVTLERSNYTPRPWRGSTEPAESAAGRGRGRRRGARTPAPVV